MQTLKRPELMQSLVIPFTKDFSSWSSDEFISRVLVESIGTRSLVIG
ncbi:MAG: hypothetical protein R2850_11695 [Bacteroidia bacterium]